MANSDEALRQTVLTQYHTPGHPTAFSSPDTVAKFHGISKEKAKRFLQESDTYVLHREYKRPHTFNPYYIYERRKLIQGDLIEIRELKGENDGINYLLLLIDVFTRKIWVYPLKRKTGADVSSVFRQWIDILDQTPETIMTDAGKEFWNRPLRALLDSHNIKLQLATGTCKAAYAERANKTLQVLIYKYLTQNETLRYIDVLPDLVASYNRREHRSLQNLSPNEADNRQNELQVRNIAIDRFQKVKRKTPKFKIGDMVRIKTDAKQISNARRAYAEQFHGEYFRIIRINKRLPIPLYYIKSMDSGEIIEGGFYANELSQIRGDVFKIDQVLNRRQRRGRREIYVRWKYFGPQWDEWIPETNVVQTY